uniref:N-acetyltransferase ESCO zinc-finger domain-containing protein n=1 Tax=Gossypium raimondii TaxID=29730 RepID=A0A0D2RH53_GOSRA|nr:hypothetical protein B456_005G179000 [Gossypium raimondii]KJB31150.1 hypothetical protein B456_005G179000 [Gossypium raimondii]
MGWDHPDISLEEMMKLIEGNDKKEESGNDKFDKPISETRVSREECGSNGRNLNKKRSYAQFHLELGQSDFLFHACSICGVKCSPGDEADERNHSIFHKNFSLGVQFKALADRESIQARSELFAYNILPLDHGGIQQAIMKFPEVRST